MVALRALPYTGEHATHLLQPVPASSPATLCRSRAVQRYPGIG